MDSELKWVALCLLVLVSGCTATVAVSYFGQKQIAAQGMEQQVTTYCDEYRTKTVWVKAR